MAPFVHTCDQQQQKLEETLLTRLKNERRRKLDLRLCGSVENVEIDFIQRLDYDTRVRLEGRLRGKPKTPVFMLKMKSWYATLDEKKKLKLTEGGLKRQALAVCKEYGVDYYSLPLNWVAFMMERIGLLLFRRVFPPGHICKWKRARKTNRKTNSPKQLTAPLPPEDDSPVNSETSISKA